MDRGSVGEQHELGRDAIKHSRAALAAQSSANRIILSFIQKLEARSQGSFKLLCLPLCPLRLLDHCFRHLHQTIGTTAEFESCATSQLADMHSFLKARACCCLLTNCSPGGGSRDASSSPSSTTFSPLQQARGHSEGLGQPKRLVITQTRRMWVRPGHGCALPCPLTVLHAGPAESPRTAPLQ